MCVCTRRSVHFRKNLTYQPRPQETVLPGIVLLIGPLPDIPARMQEGRLSRQVTPTILSPSRLGALQWDQRSNAAACAPSRCSSVPAAQLDGMNAANGSVTGWIGGIWHFFLAWFVPPCSMKVTIICCCFLTLDLCHPCVRMI